jgi:hypothetical protein
MLNFKMLKKIYSAIFSNAQIKLTPCFIVLEIIFSKEVKPQCAKCKKLNISKLACFIQIDSISLFHGFTN